MKFSVVWERSYPAGVAVAGSLAWRLVPPASRTNISVTLASPTLSVVAILVGFLGTALTLLLTAQNLPALEKLKTSKQFELLIRYNWVAVRLGLLSVVLCLIALAPKARGDLRIEDVLETLWLFFVVFGLVAFYRAISLLAKLVA